VASILQQWQQHWQQVVRKDCQQLGVQQQAGHQVVRQGRQGVQQQQGGRPRRQQPRGQPTSQP
jgi:hypothetical protein